MTTEVRRGSKTRTRVTRVRDGVGSRQNDWLASVHAQPANMRNASERGRKRLQTAVAQREWIAAAQQNFFDGRVRRDRLFFLSEQM